MNQDQQLIAAVLAGLVAGAILGGMFVYSACVKEIVRLRNALRARDPKNPKKGKD